MEKQILTDAMQTFRIEAESLAETAKVLEPEAFALAVEALAGAPRIAAAGCGHTGIACRHFAHLMCCIERPARFLSPAEAVHGGMGFLQPGDVMLLASRGGKTDELMPIADICRKKRRNRDCGNREPLFAAGGKSGHRSCNEGHAGMRSL